MIELLPMGWFMLYTFSQLVSLSQPGSVRLVWGIEWLSLRHKLMDEADSYDHAQQVQ
jgi:hypothetical protein